LAEQAAPGDGGGAGGEKEEVEAGARK
jgi:hypothetical protein